MVMSPMGTGTKHGCAGEDQQQFTRPTYTVTSPDCVALNGMEVSGLLGAVHKDDALTVCGEFDSRDTDKCELCDQNP
jgi:hypothetical protein